jgi:hypothetical protein
MLRRFGRLAVMVESSDRAGGRERTIQSFEGSIGGRRQRPRGCSWNLYLGGRSQVSRKRQVLSVAD